MTKIGRRLRASRLGWLPAIAALLLAGVTAPPAHAADLPAYGVITIVDTDILGEPPTWTKTYDSQVWECDQTDDIDASGFYTYFKVICTPKPASGLTFNCPRMVLTAAAGDGDDRVAHVVGRVQCNTSASGWLDTGHVFGVDAETRSGNLGHVMQIVCKAYDGLDGYSIVPPYTVTCSEPDLPTL